MSKNMKESLMKILVLSSHTPSLFWFRLDMMKSFIDKGYEVIAVAQESEYKWSMKFNEHGIKYRQIKVERNGLNPIKDLYTLMSLKKLLKQEKPDKVFAYQAKTIIYGSIASRLNGVAEFYPLIAGLGSIFRSGNKKDSLIKKILIGQYKLACNNSAKVLFQNNDDKNEFIRNNIVPEEKTEIINGSGVNLEVYQKTQLPANPSFLFVGRLIKDKGILEFLDASQEVKKKYPHIAISVVGPFDTNPSGIKEIEIEKFVKNGTIEFFGEQDDVRPYLSKSSVLVLPSYHEGTPKTILEAMAMGRAIITTNAPGCKETVTDGYNGLLVKVGDSNDLLQKMKYLIDYPHRIFEFGEKGLEIVKFKYDVKLVNAEIMKIMNI